MKCYKQTVCSCAECPEYDSGICMVIEKTIKDITEIPEDCPLDDY